MSAPELLGGLLRRMVAGLLFSAGGTRKLRFQVRPPAECQPLAGQVARPVICVLARIGDI